MNDNKCPQLICTLLLRKFREIPSKALPKEIANKAMDVIRYCEDEAILFDHKLALGKGGVNMFVEFGIGTLSQFMGLVTNNEYIREYNSDFIFDDFDPLPTDNKTIPVNGKWTTIFEFHRTDILCNDCPFYEKVNGSFDGSTYCHCTKMTKEFGEPSGHPFWYQYWNLCEKHNTALFDELIKKPFKLYTIKQRAAIKETQPYRLLCYRIKKRINEFIEFASNELICTFNKYSCLKKYEMGKYREPLEGLLKNTFIEEYLEFDKPFKKYIIKYAKL